METTKKVKWRRLAIILVVFIIFSLGLAYLGQIFLGRFNPLSFSSAQLAYLTLFAIAVVVNLSFVPLPFAVSVMIAAASKWDPLLVALFGSLGASLGEVSSYYVGLIGKKIAIPDEIRGYQLIQGWIRRYGVWAIACLSFQPVLPIEIGGLVAGTARMPISKFFPALWLGKFPQYICWGSSYQSSASLSYIISLMALAGLRGEARTYRKSSESLLT